MTKEEALKLALEAFESTLSDNQPYIVKCGKAITAIKEALAQPPPGRPVREPVATISITRRGTSTTIDNHFEDCVRDWPEGEYKLVLAPPLPEQEPNNTRPCRSCGGTGDQDTGIAESPIATCKPCKGTGQIALAQPEERNFCPRCGKRTADLTTIHTCTPPHDNALQRGLSKLKEAVAGSQAFYGFPHGPVSTPNAGGKCVTAGETAPKEST